MRWVIAFGFFVLAGCEVTTSVPSGNAPQQSVVNAPVRPSRPNGLTAGEFSSVVNRVEPVAERVCRQRANGANCDFKIVIDPNPGRYPNATQTVTGSGRPVLTVTQALMRDVDNADEMAFILGHEAAHHIRNHLQRQQMSAAAGATVFAGLATLSGASASAVRTAQDIGAAVGARSYSKEFELEADALGTVIAHRSGYDPVRGAVYFTRIPDPGDRFLGTHPPNASRMTTVRRVAAGL